MDTFIAASNKRVCVSVCVSHLFEDILPSFLLRIRMRKSYYTNWQEFLVSLSLFSPYLTTNKKKKLSRIPEYQIRLQTVSVHGRV